MDNKLQEKGWVNHEEQNQFVQPFCGAFAAELQTIVQSFRAKYRQPIELILTEGWVPPEPLHPDRDGHRKVAEQLISLFRSSVID